MNLKTLLAAFALSMCHVAGAQPRESGGFALMGGGADQDAAFQWICDRARSGAFVVLRATGTDAYDAYVRGLCPRVNSVNTLVIASREQARGASIARQIRKAGAVFIAGGSQDRYINWWRDTPVEDAINADIREGAPVGGTSAGLAVMGQYVFSALNDTIQSSDALRNPFDRRVTIDSNFLHIPLLKGKITDSHFVARNRMGRLIVFLARMAQNGWIRAPFGIGIDEKTAVLIDPGGNSVVVGKGAAYFLHAEEPPHVCQPDTPLSYEHIAVYRLRAGAGQFDIAGWMGHGGTAYTISAKHGVLISTQPGGEIY
jgi:cyanophycinase